MELRIRIESTSLPENDPRPVRGYTGGTLSEPTIRPIPMAFEMLRTLSAGRVSERLPIVLWQERSDSEDFTQAYQHLDFMSIYIAQRGSGVHLVEEVPFAVQAGDVYAMSMGMSHRFEASGDLSLDAIHFVPTMFGSEILNGLSEVEGLVPLFLGHPGGEVERWLRLDPAAHAQVQEMVRDLHREWERDAADRALMVQAIFLRLLVFLGRRHHSERPLESNLVSGVREAIESRYAEPLRIHDLAASVFLSPGRFTELFREAVGCSPREYLSGVRIRAAQDLLRTTDLAVSTIAVRIGIPDRAYFARFFRQETGMSPTEYREASLISR
ncbi:helix-turn-helix domain-containing protein [bacterium]|nr:MAG: helix-turn-helix domain-containing protein [bacterium]